MDNDNMEKAIYRIVINAPIDTVWSTLVATDTVLPFFFGCVCDAEGGLAPGAPMAMRTKDGRNTNVVGKVLEFDPPRRYAHTMLFTTIDEEMSTVIYDLKEVDGGTEFTLTTLTAASAVKTTKTMAQGGPMIINTLKDVCEKGQPSLGSRLMLGMMGLMAPFAPKICRSENWTFDKIRSL